MHELSLHILDLLQNSLEAGATTISLLVNDCPKTDLFIFTVEDNGRGMSDTFRLAAASPFTTSRKTRRVGLGLALLSMAAESCGGGVEIASRPGAGTRVTAEFRHSHPDRQPLGDLPGAVISALTGETELTFVWHHRYQGREFKFSTDCAPGVFGGRFQAGNAAHLSLLNDYLRAQMKILYEEDYSEKNKQF